MRHTQSGLESGVGETFDPPEALLAMSRPTVVSGEAQLSRNVIEASLVVPRPFDELKMSELELRLSDGSLDTLVVRIRQTPPFTIAVEEVDARVGLVTRYRQGSKILDLLAFDHMPGRPC